MSGSHSAAPGGPGGGGAYGGGPAEQSSAVDHALLESLFYNEMMMLDTTSPSSSNILSQSFAGAVLPHTTETDTTTIVEKEMLQDFGVTANSHVLHSPLKTTTTTQHQPAATPYYAGAPPAPAASVQISTAPSIVPLRHVANAPHAYGRTPPVYSVAPVAPPVSTPGVVAPTGLQPAPLPSQQPPASLSQSLASHAEMTPEALSIDTKQIDAPEEEKSQKLVDQFTTLASRLGIELPNNVLQSLTAAAAKTDPGDDVTNSATTNIATDGKPTKSTIAPSKCNTKEGGMAASSELDVPPTVEEMRKTAEEAIAAVTSSATTAITSMTKKRPASDDGDNNGGGDGPGSSSGKPLYSKRRKKPRLADCETRLAELQKENELLKRHVKNVSNKAIRFDQERDELWGRIKHLHDTEGAPEEMNKTLKAFTNMYSDYGSNRQQELSFHLEQLQRLVNPTNFTKLGLWTLGRTSSNPKRNPIAGILMNELDIQPQQGRKIVEQSEKIRTLCENLKESVALLAKLRSLCEQKTQIFQDRMNKCQEILTTQQVAKLALWIDENNELLETVCPGWGTEQVIHSKTLSSAPSAIPGSKK